MLDSLALRVFGEVCARLNINGSLLLLGGLNGHLLNWKLPDARPRGFPILSRPKGSTLCKTTASRILGILYRYKQDCWRNLSDPFRFFGPAAPAPSRRTRPVDIEESEDERSCKMP